MNLKFLLTLAALTPTTLAQDITQHSQGLHGYIGFTAVPPPNPENFTAGIGFYSAVWPLIDQPIANFQIGLASNWILPDNSDNKDTPLAPLGTRARNWPERGPTWSSVFQTIEGGIGYWRGNHFRYHSPKFSMNATPQCYDYEVGSPGWSFFYSNSALPDNQLGIAQLSNRLLIPPDGLPFAGKPNGEFLGYTWMALPFTKPVNAEPSSKTPPTGDQSWTCFLNTKNFKGPIAYYIPETWSKIAQIFDEPFLHGRGLDSRPATAGGGAMEINTVPRFDTTHQGATYTKIPHLKFPVDSNGEAVLVQDVTYYAKSALYNDFKAWRDGGPPTNGRFTDAIIANTTLGTRAPDNDQGPSNPNNPRFANRKDPDAWRSTLTTRTTRYNQAQQPIEGVEQTFNTKIFPNNTWGLEWFDTTITTPGSFPQYFKQVDDKRIPIPAQEAPQPLRNASFPLATPGDPYTSPQSPAWTTPGPATDPYTTTLTDGSTVTYAWYRFVDQPSLQQYNWSNEKKANLQALVERIHATWPIDRDYMPPPTQGTLVTLDPALIVTPPAGMEHGYVPIVTGQSAP